MYRVQNLVLSTQAPELPESISRVSNTAHRLGLQHRLPSLVLILPHGHGLRGKRKGVWSGLWAWLWIHRNIIRNFLVSRVQLDHLLLLGWNLELPFHWLTTGTPWCWLTGHSDLLGGAVHTLHVLGGPNVSCPTQESKLIPGSERRVVLLGREILHADPYPSYVQVVNIQENGDIVEQVSHGSDPEILLVIAPDLH